MKNSLTRMTPAWHTEAAQLLNENFGKIHAAFTDATKRAVWMGMFLNHIKAKGKEDGSIPHGEFGPWLKKNVPDLARDTITTYMNLAVSVCEKGKFEITEFPQFAQSGSLPPKIEKMIEGKTQQQLFLQFKNVDANGDPVKAGGHPVSSGRKLTPEEIADIEDPLLEIENHLISLTDESDLTFADVKSVRLARFSAALKACYNRAEHILKARKAACP